MLLLFETPAGFALFTVLQENKLEEAKVGGGRIFARTAGARPE